MISYIFAFYVLKMPTATSHNALEKPSMKNTPPHVFSCLNKKHTFIIKSPAPNWVAGFFFLLTACVFTTGCGWTRIGSLTMASTRNVESKLEYKLIAKNANGISRRKQQNAFQEAIDNAVAQYPEAEFMKNVVVYIKDNGRKIKVEGDVWGIPSVEKNITQKVTTNINYAVGDKVAFKNNHGKIIEGNIIGINSNSAMVEYPNAWNNKKQDKDSFTFDKLTKLQPASINTTIEKRDEAVPKQADKPTENISSKKQLYKVTSTTLNLKALPSISSQVILKIRNGESVELIEKTNSAWWKIKYNNQVGFVNAKYLSQ